MATFPSIAPIHSAPKRTSAPEGLFSFGDGYKRATRFGINSIKPEWNLTWELNAADANTIDAFLQARANAGDSFDWQPPDSATAVRWRCDEWTVEQTAYNWFRVSATLRRVFELTIPPVVVPVAATCDDDELCEPERKLPFLSSAVPTTWTYEYGLGTYAITYIRNLSNTPFILCSDGSTVYIPAQSQSNPNTNTQYGVYGLRFTVRSARLTYTCSGSNNFSSVFIYEFFYKTAAGSWVRFNFATDSDGTGLFNPRVTGQVDNSMQITSVTRNGSPITPTP